MSVTIKFRSDSIGKGAHSIVVEEGTTWVFTTNGILNIINK